MRRWLALALGIAIVAGLVLFGVLSWLAFAPNDVVREEPGIDQGFGGFDAHLRVTVLSADRLPSKIPGTDRYRVLVRVYNDAADEDFTVDPSLLKVVLRSAGQEWQPLALPPGEAPPQPITRFHNSALGQEKDEIGAFVFDLPAGTGDPELWITSDTAVDRLLRRIAPSYDQGRLQQRLVVPLTTLDQQPNPD